MIIAHIQTHSAVLGNGNGVFYLNAAPAKLVIRCFDVQNHICLQHSLIIRCDRRVIIDLKTQTVTHMVPPVMRDTIAASRLYCNLKQLTGSDAGTGCGDSRLCADTNRIIQTNGFFIRRPNAYRSGQIRCITLIVAPVIKTNQTSTFDRNRLVDGTVSLLKQQNVRALCTTDDPADSLEWHQQIRRDDGIPFEVLPSFRPDRYLEPEHPGARKHLSRLAESTGVAIADIDGLKHALCVALDHFQACGCVVADHGLSCLRGGADEVREQLLLFLGEEYRRRGMVMQLHLGPIRDQSPRLLETVGHDAGGDSVGATSDPAALGHFLAKLESGGGLPRVILYNLNPAESAVFSTMAVNFAPQVQYGAAWWFNDTLRGINAQLDELMETGLLAHSAGMLTDSRSFTSFPRHEYYRRILCAKLGKLVDGGQYPADIAALGRIVENVCWKNAAALLRL